jgi:hypothetical protein
VYATGQIADKIIYEGDTLNLHANPLEMLYDSMTRPEWFFERSSCSSTACWRGYIAYWEVIDGRLYLTQIGTCCPDRDTIVADLKRMFGEKCADGKVHAYWVTATIYAPFGKMLFYEHTGYERIHEYEHSFKIEAGQVVEVNTFDNTKTIVSDYYKDSKKLRTFLYSNVDAKLFKDVPNGKKIYIQITSGDNGKVGQVEIVKGMGEPYDSKIKDAVMQLPQWLTLYNHGQPTERKVVFPFIVDRGKLRRYGR